MVLSLRDKCNPSAVRRPDWNVVVGGIECEAGLATTDEVLNPNIQVLLHNARESQTLAVGRQFWVVYGFGVRSPRWPQILSRPVIPGQLDLIPATSPVGHAAIGRRRKTALTDSGRSAQRVRKPHRISGQCAALQIQPLGHQ